MTENRTDRTSRFYAGRVTISRLRPSEAESLGWQALIATGTRVVVPGKGEHIAFSNANGAISVASGDGFFGLRPGEFVWVEQSEFVIHHTGWAGVDGAHAWIDKDKPVLPITWHLRLNGINRCHENGQNVASTNSVKWATCPACLTFYWHSIDAFGIAFVDELAECSRDGRKTVTRRLVTANTSLFGEPILGDLPDGAEATGGIRTQWPRLDFGKAKACDLPPHGKHIWAPIDVPDGAYAEALDGTGPVQVRAVKARRIYPRRRVGDVLWVRERWRPIDYKPRSADEREAVLVEYGAGGRRWCLIGNAELAPAYRGQGEAGIAMGSADAYAEVGQPDDDRSHRRRGRAAACH